MDVKKTDIKNRVKEFFSGYMGIYFEDIPKTREEIKEKILQIFLDNTQWV